MSEHLLDVDDLVVEFATRRSGLLGERGKVRAVHEVSFHIERGETFGLVGESGSGKSTTARSVLQLVRPTSGSVRLDGVELTEMRRRPLRSMRKRMQMVFQDPYSSLDPSAMVGNSIAEPLSVHQGLRGQALDQRVGQLLERVGLPARWATRYPHEFSGGQRQRIAIARAIALEPDLIVCDEAVSALDVSTQNQVIELLGELRRDFGIAYLFIAHDLAVVRHIADRVGVMYLGEIVEVGPVDRVFDSPSHPYTRALLSAVPVPDPERDPKLTRVVLSGDVPDPSDPPSGCRFHTRCPEAIDICRTTLPPKVHIDGGGEARCHLLVGRVESTTPVEPPAANHRSPSGHGASAGQ